MPENSRELVTKALSLEIDLANENMQAIPATIFGGGAWAVYNADESFASIFASAEKFARIYLHARRKHASAILFLSSGCNNILAGSLGAEINYRGAFPPEVSEHINESKVNNVDVASINEDDRISIIRSAYKIAKENAEKEKFLLALTSWGPFTLASQLVGIEKMLLMIKREKNHAEKVLKLAEHAIIAFYEPLAESGYLELASIAEANASGDLISADDFKSFSMPYLKRIIKKIKKHGSKTLLHVCGEANDRIEPMLASGADCISIDYKTSLINAMKKARKKACVAGNMRARLLMSDEQEIRKHAKACFEQARKAIEDENNSRNEAGYILMPGCDAPLKAGASKLKAFTTALKKNK